MRMDKIISHHQIDIVQDTRQQDKIVDVRSNRTTVQMRGGRIEERRQSDVSACSRAVKQKEA